MALKIGNGEPKKDCFAYNGLSFSLPCEALGKLHCLMGECSFYKTGAQEARELHEKLGVWTIDDAIREYAETRSAKQQQNGGDHNGQGGVGGVVLY